MTGTWRRLRLFATVSAATLTVSAVAHAQYKPVSEGMVVDLTPTVSMSHKQYWPGGQKHHQPIIVPYVQHGPGPFAADLLIVDENTGAQLD